MQHVTQPPDAQKNFLVVDAKTQNSDIEAAFDRFVSERKDIAILLINQHVRIHARFGTDVEGAEVVESGLTATDCRKDKAQGRDIHGSLPLSTRDPVQRPPIRP